MTLAPLILFDLSINRPAVFYPVQCDGFSIVINPEQNAIGAYPVFLKPLKVLGHMLEWLFQKLRMFREPIYTF